MSGNLGGSARDVTAPERVVEKKLVFNFRKMPRSQTDWLLVCNETFQGSRSETLGVRALSKR